MDFQNTFFKPEPKKNIKKPRVWNIKVIKEQLGPNLRSNILFLHAMDVILLHNYMALENQAGTSKNKQRCLLQNQLLHAKDIYTAG